MPDKDDKTAVQSAKDGVTSDFSSFSSEANIEFKRSIQKCIDNLFQESKKLMKLHGAQQVSVTDVERATNYLYSDRPKNKRKQYANDFACVCSAIPLTIVVEWALHQLSFDLISTLIAFFFMFVCFILFFYSNTQD
jgi:hypothetical protein